MASTLDDLFVIERACISQAIFGKVMRARVRSTGEAVAIKVFDTRRAERHTTRAGAPVLEDAATELRLLRHLAQPQHAHPNLMGMHPSESHLASSDRVLHAVMDFADAGDLLGHLRAHDLSEDDARDLFMQILGAVRHLHAMGWAHRDISLENILMVSNKKEEEEEEENKKTASPRPVLCDFGLAREDPSEELRPSIRCRPGKQGYMAPEIYAYKPYTGAAADMYSLGVVLFGLLARSLPYTYPCRSMDAAFRMIQDGQLDALLRAWRLRGRFSDDAVDLVAGLMRTDPAARLTMEQVVAHPWCAGHTPAAAAVGGGVGVGGDSATVEVVDAAAVDAATPAAGCGQEEGCPTGGAGAGAGAGSPCAGDDDDALTVTVSANGALLVTKQHPAEARDEGCCDSDSSSSCSETAVTVAAELVVGVSVDSVSSTCSASKSDDDDDGVEVDVMNTSSASLLSQSYDVTEPPVIAHHDSDSDSDSDGADGEGSGGGAGSGGNSSHSLLDEQATPRGTPVRVWPLCLAAHHQQRQQQQQQQQRRSEQPQQQQSQHPQQQHHSHHHMRQCQQPQLQLQCVNSSSSSSKRDDAGCCQLPASPRARISRGTPAASATCCDAEPVDPARGGGAIKRGQGGDVAAGAGAAAAAAAAVEASTTLCGVEVVGQTVRVHAAGGAPALTSSAVGKSEDVGVVVHKIVH